MRFGHFPFEAALHVEYTTVRMKSMLHCIRNNRRITEFWYKKRGAENFTEEFYCISLYIDIIKNKKYTFSKILIELLKSYDQEEYS